MCLLTVMIHNRLGVGRLTRNFSSPNLLSIPTVTQEQSPKMEGIEKGKRKKGGGPRSRKGLEQGQEEK